MIDLTGETIDLTVPDTIDLTDETDTDDKGKHVDKKIQTQQELPNDIRKHVMSFVLWHASHSPTTLTRPNYKSETFMTPSILIN